MNKQEDFKYIKGRCCPGCPADICFYTDVDYWSVDRFLWEFDYLVNNIEPSKIRIHINSVGGSVVDGMSVFSKIMDCKIPTECINDALAASMGSVIWAAGDELFMKDYALLMIHNPFVDHDGEKEHNQVTDAFTQQLKTIYIKRFGLSEDEVEAIMDGKAGDDGTFLTASQAVERGFLKAENIIETPKVVKDRVQAALKGSKDIGQIKAVYELLEQGSQNGDCEFVMDQTGTQTNTTNTNTTKNSTMEKHEIAVFAAIFGLAGEKATVENVTAKINEVKNKAEKAENLEKELADVKSQLARVEADLTGAQTSVNNLTDDLNKTKAALQKYQEAEKTAKAEKVKALIDKAVTDCKINKDERDTYTKMAESDYDLAVSVLAKIPARDNLGNIISEANRDEAKAGMKTEEQKAYAMVEEVVGKDFKFRSLD